MTTYARFGTWTALLALLVAAPVRAEPPAPKVLPLRPKEPLHHLLTFSPDSKTLVAVCETWQPDAGTFKSSLVLFDVASGKEQRRLPLPEDGSPNGFLISPDGRVLAAHRWRAALVLRDVREGKLVRELPSSDRVLEAVFSPDGTRMIARVHRPEKDFRPNDDTQLVVWDVASGKVVKRIEAGRAGEMRAFAVAADGEHVLVEHHRLGGVNQREQPTLPWRVETHVWSLTTGRDLGTVGRVTTYDQTGADHSAPGENLFLAGCAGRGYRSSGLQGGDLYWTPWQGRLQFSQQGRPVVGPDYRPAVPVLQWDGAVGFSLADPAANKPLHDADYFAVRNLHAVALSPDGTKAAAADFGPDKQPRLRLWDVTDLAERLRSRAPKLTDERLDALWEVLRREDVVDAHPAMRELAAAPARSLPLLRAKVRPLPEADATEKELRWWIADLDADDFAVREAAASNLERAGVAAKPVMEKALAAKPSEETARRLRGLLRTLEHSISPEELRLLRGVDVLEHIGTDEARQILRTLADGAETASLTRAAKQALARLADERTPRRPE
jgi:dipeptidyl aminopeptidase/acylaminoacyl peptidase